MKILFIHPNPKTNFYGRKALYNYLIKKIENHCTFTRVK